MKKVEASGVKSPADEATWAHVACALWMDGTGIKESKGKAGAAGKFSIVGLDKVAPFRWEDACDVCHSTAGAVMSCHSVGCRSRAHVTCALSNWESLFWEPKALCTTAGHEVAKPNFPIGQLVMAVWPEDGEMYPGTIDSLVLREKMRVKWDDNGEPSMVPAGHIQILRDRSQVPKIYLL